MDIYQLDYILHEPEESPGWMYLAEVPALQGCMAWGDTPEQTLDELRAVAKALIQSRQERGVPLPPEVTPQRTGKGEGPAHRLPGRRRGPEAGEEHCKAILEAARVRKPSFEEGRRAGLAEVSNQARLGRVGKQGGDCQRGRDVGPYGQASTSGGLRRLRIPDSHR